MKEIIKTITKIGTGLVIGVVLTWNIYDYAASDAKWNQTDADFQVRVDALQAKFGDKITERDEYIIELQDLLKNSDTDAANLSKEVAELEKSAEEYEASYLKMYEDYSDLIEEYNHLKAYADSLHTRYEAYEDADLDQLEGYVDGIKTVEKLSAEDLANLDGTTTSEGSEDPEVTP